MGAGFFPDQGLDREVNPVAPPCSDLPERVEEFFESALTGLEGYEIRPAQRRMAAAVAELLVEGGRLAVEAETGTGKSLAYLVPLLLREATAPAVVATKTLQLQDQLVQRELPFLQSRLQVPRKVVQARGWSNYLCLRKLESPGEETVRELAGQLSSLRALANQNQGRVIRQEVDLGHTHWVRLQADPLDCQKSRCSHFARCGLFAERRELETADLIVTNHAFLLSDLKARREGASLLPPCDVLVLDEAHRLDEVATSHLTVRVDADRLASTLTVPLQGWLESVRFALLAHLPESHLLDWTARFDRLVGMALKDMEQLGEALLAELAALRSVFPGQGSLPHSLLRSSQGEPTANLASELAYGLEALVGNLLTLANEYDELAPVQSPPELARLARALQSLARDLDFLLSAQDEEWVFLCELYPPALLARPVDNSQALDAELFAEFSSVLVTSATLQVNDSFDFFFQRSGLDRAPTRELALASPFDVVNSTFVGLANQGLDPTQDGYLQSLLPCLEELILGLGGRTFLLTTSHRSLLELAQGLEQPLREAGISALVQGRAPPGQLLRRFAGSGAHVLLGVDTFWEGVDIPGERLSCVVLTRLPFPVPTDPLFQARSQRIEQAGGSAFDQLSLPLAALKVKQGFGRLLRSVDDRGIFLLLDPRIGRRSYGRRLARNLPGGHARLASPDCLVQWALDWAEQNLVRNHFDQGGFP
jgi:ATP-dependent DNA helicase DinG